MLPYISYIPTLQVYDDTYTKDLFILQIYKSNIKYHMLKYNHWQGTLASYFTNLELLGLGFGDGQFASTTIHYQNW